MANSAATSRLATASLDDSGLAIGSPARMASCSSAGARPSGIGSVKPVNWAYQRAPMIVYWELTNACGLACRHCRATAMPDPAPGELTTAEAIALLDDITGFGTPLPHLVMTGGDRTGSAATVVPVEGSLAGAVKLMTGPASDEVTGAMGTTRGGTSEGVTVSALWIGGVGAGGTLGDESTRL